MIFRCIVKFCSFFAPLYCWLSILRQLLSCDIIGLCPETLFHCLCVAFLSDGIFSASNYTETNCSCRLPFLPASVCGVERWLSDGKVCVAFFHFVKFHTEIFAFDKIINEYNWQQIRNYA